MSERDEVQPQGSCPWNICAEAHYSHAKGARNATAEKTNAVFRRRLTCGSSLSVAAEAKKPRNAAIRPRNHLISVSLKNEFKLSHCRSNILGLEIFIP